MSLDVVPLNQLSWRRVKFALMLFIVSLVGLLNGCMTNSATKTVTDANGRPAWTQAGFQPNEGIVRSSPLHIQGREKTRELVLDQSLVELAKAQFGTEISLHSKVTKSTQSYNDQVGVRESHIDYAEITSADDTAKVRAQVKAEWYDAVTQRLYLWVVPLQ